MIRRSVILLLSLGVCLAWVNAALAADAPPVSDDAALLDQYVEQVPSAAGTNGGSGGGGGSGSGTGTGLPDSLGTQLVLAVGRDDATTLEEVATSSQFGAPQTNLAGRAANDPGSSNISGGDNVFSSAASVLQGGGGDSHLAALAVLLGLVTGSAILAAALRRRPVA
jgi:hypothetical protein